MVAKARSDWGQLPLGIRLALFATAVLVAGYGLVAVRSEPLAAGPDGAFLPAPGQAAVTDPAVVQQLSFGESTPRGIYTPMIGASAVLVQSLTNDGQVPLTVTGIEPSDLLGSLLQVKDPRVAVMSAPEKCCDLNSQATWSASGFRPVTVAPGATTYVAVHVLMTNCQLNRGSERIESIKALTVDYSVLGFPHTTQIDVDGYWIEGPPTAPTEGCAFTRRWSSSTSGRASPGRSVRRGRNRVAHVVRAAVGGQVARHKSADSYGHP